MQCFPGASGEGTDTPHARDPAAVSLFVTNLNDEGPGSRRAALLDPRPGYIIYTVSGRIDNPDRAVKVKFSNKYDACHTSPGGVCFSGEETQFQTHDVLTRFARFFTGDVDVPAAGYDNRDCLNSGDPDDLNIVHHLVWDHCEGRFAIDESFTRWYATEHSTWMNGIITEALFRSKHPKGQHSMGMLWGIAARWVHTHHSILWACNQRMPQSAGCIDKTLLPAQVPIANHFSVTNCFIGDWGEEPLAIEHLGNTGNIVNNHFALGPDFNMSRKNAVRVAPDATDLRLYIEGNISPTNPDGTLDNWTQDVMLDNGTNPPTVPNRLLVPDAQAAITTIPASEVRQYVLNNAGAIKPFADSAHTRTMAQIRRRCRRPGEHYFINSVADVGGWPTYANLPYPQDSNGDGIPDSFCIAHGLSPFATVMNDITGNGYSVMENYLNELAGDPVPPW